jgi:hypothetical protein
MFRSFSPGNNLWHTAWQMHKYNFEDYITVIQPMGFVKILRMSLNKKNRVA